MSKVLILGAGISGLSLAYRLQQLAPHIDVTVLETESRIGGKIWTERQDGFVVEHGPNGFLDTKPSTLALCRELGLERELIPASDEASKNRFLFFDGKLKRMPRSLSEFIRTDLLSWRGKLRLLAERWVPNRRVRLLLRTPAEFKIDTAILLGSIQDESVDAFARRRAGNEVANVFADALVTGIYAGNPEQLSILSAFPRVAEFEQKYGSVTKGMVAAARQRRKEAQARGEPYHPGGKMWSLRSGLRRLIEALASHLRVLPLCGVPVRRINRSEGKTPKWTVHVDSHDSWTADTLVMSCPAHEQARLLGDVDPELAAKINRIKYNRIAVVAFGYRRNEVSIPLDGFGYIAPQRTKRDLLGVQWCSSIFPDRVPPGMILMRALCGGASRPDIVDWADARLIGALRAELRLAMGIEATPSFVKVIRWEKAIPQYHLGHEAIVNALNRRLRQHPGLFLAGNAYYGVAMNDCTEQAEKLALEIRDFLQ